MEQLENLNWENLAELGINSKAFSLIAKSGLKPQLFFSHPDLLRTYPKFARYYRLLALLPSKGVQRSGIKVGKKSPYDRLFDFSRYVNSISSQLILEGFREESIISSISAQIGAQLEGSWRNLIGKQAANLVEKLILEWLIEENQTFATEPSVPDIEDELSLGNMELISKINRISSDTYLIEFGSEPDIKITRRFNGEYRVVAWIEVKGGTDPAGVLERYGAAKKSLEEARVHRDRPRSILIMAIYTTTALERIKDDRLVDEYYNLTSLTIKDSVDWKNFERSLKLLLGI